MTDYQQYTADAVELLKQLISTPSISREEHAAADVLVTFIQKWGLPCRRIGNNVLIQEEMDEQKPTLLLNAHIDTVKPVSSWTRDPFSPLVEGDRLFGLGSNDCGGGLVALLQGQTRLLGDLLEYQGMGRILCGFTLMNKAGGETVALISCAAVVLLGAALLLAAALILRRSAMKTGGSRGKGSKE